jgi:hypothetical protein
LRGEFAPPRFFSGEQLRRDGPLEALKRRRLVEAEESKGPRPTLRFVRALKTAK